MSIGSVYEKAYKGDFNQVKVKIDEDKSLVTTPDSNIRLLIHWAALGGNHHLVDYLIDSGSPIDFLDDTQSTPLVLAASAGRFEVVRLLIAKNANVNHKTLRGQTALHYACSKGHMQIAKMLLENDANINERDILGITPLHRAAAQGRANIVELLLQHPKVEIDVPDSLGNTPLHFACEEDRESVACMMVKSGADLKRLNSKKEAPINVCSKKLSQTLLALVK